MKRYFGFELLSIGGTLFLTIIFLLQYSNGEKDISALSNRFGILIVYLLLALLISNRLRQINSDDVNVLIKDYLFGTYFILYLIGFSLFYIFEAAMDLGVVFGVILGFLPGRLYLKNVNQLRVQNK